MIDRLGQPICKGTEATQRQNNYQDADPGFSAAEKITGNFILGNFLLGNFIYIGKFQPPKNVARKQAPPKFRTPGKDHRQDQGNQGELMVANFLPPNICLVRSCAPNICLHGAEELGERMFAWEGAAGQTFAWASGAARSAATNKKKKKKIFFPFYYIKVLKIF